MDLDISQLLSDLASTQAIQSAVRLSERNVVELVIKLKALGILGGDLLHTSNGREFITPSRLKTEVSEALTSAGGRLSLVELPVLLGVDGYHCDQAAAEVVAESAGLVTGTQGELITGAYFDGLAREVNDLLQESGQVGVGELAMRYALSTETLLAVLRARLGSRLLTGRLEGMLLYTPAYLRNAKARLRGALRGLLSPCSLAAVVRDLGLEGLGAVGGGGGGGGGGGPSVVSGLVEELASAQQASVGAFYRSNGWIGYDTVRKLGLANEKAYLRSAFPEGISLSAAHVSPSTCSGLEAALEDALSGEDVEALLSLTLARMANGSQLRVCGGGAAVVSEALIKAQQAAAQQVIAPQPRKAAGKQKGGQESDEDDSWAVGGGAKGKGKKKGGGGGTAAAAAKAPAQPPSGISARSLASRLQSWCPTLGEVDDAIATELAAALLPTALASHGAAVQAARTAGADDRRRVRDVLAGAFEEAFHRLQLYARGNDVFAADEATHATLQRHALRTTGGTCVDLLFKFSRVEYGSEEAHPPVSPPPSSSPSPPGTCDLQSPVSVTERASLCRQVPKDIRASLTTAVGALSMDPKALSGWRSSVQELRHTVQPRSCARLPRCIAVQTEASPPLSALDRQAQRQAVGVISTHYGRDMPLPWDRVSQEAEAVWEQCASDVGMRMLRPRVDKKNERALLAALRQGQLAALASLSAPAEVLALGVPLLFTKVTGKALNAPGKVFSQVLLHLKDHMQPASYACIMAFHDDVVTSLKSQGLPKGALPESEDLDTRLRAGMETLRSEVGC
ncbi:MAG: hypothetical protein WDW36_010090 [Sanguina aurantia]